MSKTLTDHLKDIGEEQVNIRVDGLDKTVTRTEALARKMFLLAQGGIEEIVNDKSEVVQIVHKPDYRVAKMLREFIEGKPASEPTPEKKPGAKAGRYSSETARRLNERLAPGQQGKRPMRSAPRQPSGLSVSFAPGGIG